MKLYMYAYYNKLGSFFGAIFTEKSAPEDMKQNILQGLVSVSDEVLDSLKEDDLYCLGTFDNVSGEIDFKKDFIIDISPLVSDIRARKEELHGKGKGNKKA